MSGDESHMSMGRVVFSAARIAELMVESPAQAVVPTPEQIAVIEQPLGGSVLVVAGAGSGKTETMANRVVWLVANGLARPSQILGLTFTRKAAGELGERVAGRLMRFAEMLDQALQAGLLSAEEAARSEALTAVMSEGLDLPEVSTYNAFASAIVQEFGAIAGVAAGATVIDGPRAWGIAREVVCRSEEPGLAESGDSIGVIVKQIMTLDHAVSDNLTSFDAVRKHTQELSMLGELPYNEKKREGRYAKIDTVLGNMEATGLAVRLAERFSEEKRRLGLIEFSDQLALAVATLRCSSDATMALRARTPVVLLDEVQDTSVGQTTLLSMLFRGCAVMAVGDPHQSIYGFRGASASNLQTFHRDFRGAGSSRDTGSSQGAGSSRCAGSSQSADITLSLSTSWRNPSSILAAANTVSAPLAAKLDAETSGISVKPLTSRAQYLGQNEAASQGELEVRVEETLAEEFDALALWMRRTRNEHLERKGEPATAAVVFRSRRHMGAVSESLWAAGVPNRIVGLGGLLTTPEVTDLVCALRCIWFADAGSELIRLLAGPRFRIGVSDLNGLRQAARWFSVRDHTKRKISDADIQATPALTDPERSFTLLDALDEIAMMPGLDHSALSAVTEVGRERLQEAGQMLRRLRQEVGGDLPSLISSVVAALRLDIELDASEHTGYDGSAVARANLDAFGEMVEGFLATDERGTLSSVLAWLERATDDDEVAEHTPEPEPGVVQLITVHGSKGLEWDLVAIPRLVDGEFPGSSREGMGWLRPGQLPDELRGDAAARPRLDFSISATQKEAIDAIAVYQDALKDRHAAEERRLAYVAITRAASRLLLTYSFWGGQAKARGPAVFLQELADAGLIGELQRESAHEGDPSASEDRTKQWPLDPLGRRREVVDEAASLVRNGVESDSETATLHPVVELLLAELLLEERSVAGSASERSRAVDPAGSEGAPTSSQLVGRLTASTFHEFIENPVEAERRRLRPMPIRPYRRTRTGNLFHEWVERRASTAQGTSLFLTGLDPEDTGLDFESRGFDPEATGSEPEGAELEFERNMLAETKEDLQALIAQFEGSRWADRQPIAVELEISIPFAGRTLVCKLDAVYQEDLSELPGANVLPRFEIVDWKSGRPPRNDEERSLRFLQLELYRHAYARWAEIDPAQIDVTLFYVAEGQELRGTHTRSFEDLEQLWFATQQRDWSREV